MELRRSGVSFPLLLIGSLASPLKYRHLHLYECAFYIFLDLELVEVSHYCVLGI